MRHQWVLGLWWQLTDDEAERAFEAGLDAKVPDSSQFRARVGCVVCTQLYDWCKDNDCPGELSAEMRGQVTRQGKRQMDRVSAKRMRSDRKRVERQFAEAFEKRKKVTQ